MYEYEGICWNDVSTYSKLLLSKNYELETLLDEFGFDKNLEQYFNQEFNNFKFSKTCIYYKLKKNSFDYSFKNGKIVLNNYLLLAQNVFVDLFIYKQNPQHTNCSNNIIEILFFYVQLRKYFDQEGKNFSKCVFTNDFKQ